MMHEEEALWRQTCAEIEAINATLPREEHHEIPTWDAWCDYFRVPAEVWAAMLEPLEPVGEPQHMNATEPLPSPDGQWWPWDSSDYLLALRHPGKLATKRFVWANGKWQKQSYGKGWLYEVSVSPEITSLDALAAFLARLESESEYFIVRGEPTRPGPIERSYLDGNFQCVDRRWLMVDIDEVEGDCIEDAIALLPDYMREAACWYQYSASAGMEPGKVKVHLWYWLDRPVCCFSLRQWAKSLGGLIDSMLYNPVQPHFTARPVIIGAPDPMPNRSGMRGGNPVLVLPPSVVDLATFHSSAEAANEARKAAIPSRTVESATAGTSRQRYAQRALSNACDAIRGASVGGRHLTIIGQAASVGELLDYLDEGLATDELIAAARDALNGEGRDREAEKTVRDGLAIGRKNPRDLSHIGMIEVPAGFDDAALDALFAPKIEPPKEDADMRYIRVCLSDPRPMPMPHHYNPGLLMDELVWCPGAPHVEQMAYELSEWLNMRRRRVEAESELPPINQPGE